MEKQPILLLHGALGAQAQLMGVKKHLENNGHPVTVFEFTGHGNTPLGQDFSIAGFATELIRFVSERNLEGKFLVLGYSMGGYAALVALKQFPQLFKGIITLATKFNWTPESAIHEVRLLSPIKIKEKVPAFAQVLDKRHVAINWEVNMSLTAQMMLELGNKPELNNVILKELNVPIVYSVGDRDEMITLEETIAAYNHTPHAALVVLPMTSHPIEKLNIELVSVLINAWDQCAFKYPTSQTND